MNRVVFLGNTTSPSALRLIEEFKLQSCTVEAHGLRALSFGFKGNQFFMCANNHSLLEADIFIIRGAGAYRDIARYITRQLESLGKVVLDASSGLANYFSDKLFLLPESPFFKVPDQEVLSIKNQSAPGGYPYVYKDIEGGIATGVRLITNDTEELAAFAELQRRQRRFFIKQQFVPLIEDFRVMVVGDAAFGAMARILADPQKEFRTNKARASTKEYRPLPQNVLDECVKLAKKQQLSLAGIDLFVHDGQYYVLEVNSSPQFIVFEETTGINIAAAIVALLLARKLA